MKIRSTEKLRRYDDSKKGSYQTELSFFDWELSSLIGAIRVAKEKHKGNRAYSTFLNGLEARLSKALSEVLKTQQKDLKQK